MSTPAGMEPPMLPTGVQRPVLDWLVDPTKYPTPYPTPALTATTNASRVAMTQFLMVLEGCESFRGALSCMPF